MPTIAFTLFADEIRALYRPPHRAKGTFAKLDQVLREFSALGPIKKTSDIRPPAIARWVEAHADRSPVTSYSLLRSFRTAVNYALSCGYLKTDPFLWRKPARWFDLEPIEDETPRPKHHGLAAVAKVLDLLEREARQGGWSEGRLHALVATYAYTGLRKQEALRLLVADVDLAERMVVIKRRSRRGLKTVKSAAHVPICDELASILARWLPRTGCVWAFPGRMLGGPWDGGKPGCTPLDRIKAAGARAGVKGFTIQSLRHSFGTHARRWGLGPLDVKAILRHTTTRTQDWYQHDDLDDLRDSAKGISYARTAT